jgi:hypothetical protein
MKAEAGKGSKERQARASKQVDRGMKQRSKVAGKGRLGCWQVSRVEKHRAAMQPTQAAWQTGRQASKCLGESIKYLLGTG